MPPAKQPRDLLLRYRFDAVAQLRNHLHRQGARSVLFFRDPALEADRKDRVVIEFAVGEQQMVLRGTVVERHDGGVWLVFPDTKLLEKLSGGDVAARRQRRVPMDLLVELRSRTARVGRFLDVSLGGARVGGAAGLTTGTRFDLRLLSTLPDVPLALGKADVVRASDSEVAVRFLRSDPQTRLAVTKLFDAARKRWANAPEVVHPPGCCIGDVVDEPGPPRDLGSGLALG